MYIPSYQESIFCVRNNTDCSIVSGVIQYLTIRLQFITNQTTGVPNIVFWYTVIHYLKKTFEP